MIPLASNTPLDVTLFTSEDKASKGIITILTLVLPLDPLPILVSALVVFSQLLHHPPNLLLSRLRCWVDPNILSFDDHSGTCQKSVLIPLWTYTGLPALPAAVAEFGIARTSG